MDQISVYFERFKTIGLGDRIIKKNLLESIIEVIGEECREDLSIDKIDILKQSVRVRVFGPLKNEIFLNKDLIQEKFNKISGSSKDLV